MLQETVQRYYLKVTVDNTAPVAGVLSFNNLTDTGISSTDLITQDKALISLDRTRGWNNCCLSGI
jgi:hypothetical protein